MAEAARSSSSLTSEELSCEEWLRRVGALTIVPPSGGHDDEIVTATKTGAALVAAARSLVDQGLVPREPGAGPCAVCREPKLSCDLVRDLAARWPGEGSPPPVDLAGYRRALAAAGATVFTCRRTLHPSGGCVFGPGDLCGRVLAAAHRLG